METMGLLFSVFLMLFDVLEGDCSYGNEKETAAPCKQASRKVEEESGFEFMCWYSDYSCRKARAKDVVKKMKKKKNAAEKDLTFKREIESSLELHLFMFAPISPRPLLVLPWKKWKERDCCFLYFECSSTSFEVFASGPWKAQMKKENKLATNLMRSCGHCCGVVTGKLCCKLAAARRLTETRRFKRSESVKCGNTWKKVGSSELGEGGWKLNGMMVCSRSPGFSMLSQLRFSMSISLIFP